MKVTIISKKKYPQLKKFHDNFTVGKDGDIYIAIGGDGTFIRTAQTTEKPVLLIRDEEGGSIGYHSDLKLEDVDLVIENIKKGNYTVENIANKIEIIYKNKHYFAVNEARLNNLLEEVSFNIYEVLKKSNSTIYPQTKRKIYPFVMSGDGVIITSKIGSTAYNLSAGGPVILTPQVLCLTFLNPNAPFRNSIITDSNIEIEIEVIKYKGNLIYDGTQVDVLKPGDTFRVKLSSRKINVVRFKGKTMHFAERLERKIKSRIKKNF
ncbi:MAG: hypothetical protein ABR981_03380 [Candidatus Micrarchaeaceae archaeon]|jgi:NAD+ kinase